MVIFGFLIALVLWTGAYFIYLQYAKVSEKIWQRAAFLAVITLVTQLFTSLVLNLIGLGWLASMFTALVMAFVLVKVLTIKFANALLASFIIVVVGQVFLATIGGVLS